MKYYKYYVCAKCFTYNQKDYIRDALNGFANQKTSFPFVVTIVDDASTDGTDVIIKDYLRGNFLNNSFAYSKETDYAFIEFFQHKSNYNCFFAVLFLKENHYQKKIPTLPYLTEWLDASKYHAVCEGDDYWVDDNKLQKQVDFMESHHGYSQCFTAHACLYPDGKMESFHRYNQNVEDCPIQDAITIGGGYMATPTMLYRGEDRREMPQWSKNLPIGDLPSMLVLFSKGKCGYINDITAVYRVSAKGSWSNTMKADYSKKMHLYSSIKKMWKDYDVWTNKKYHKWVRIKIMRNNISMLHDKLRHFIKKK